MYLVFAVLNAVLVFHALRQSLRERPFAFLFWAASAFFTAYPLLVDSFYCVTGHLDIILSLYRFRADGVAPVLDDVILTRTSSFVFSFNLIFYLVLALVGGRQPQWRTTTLSAYDAAVAKILAYMVAIGGVVSLVYIIQVEYGGLRWSLQQGAAYYGMDPNGYIAKYRYLRELGNAFVYASPFAAYYGIRVRNPMLIGLGLLPPLALAYVTSQRPWLFCAAGVLVLYALGPGYADTRRQVARARGFFATPARIVMVVGLAALTMFSAYFVRYGRTDSFVGDTADAAFESADSVLAMRDASIFVLYWTMNMVPDSLAPIGGYSTLQIPATILHLPIEFEQMEQVGYFLALHRNGWSDTTLHPTVYGFAFCDLAWGGLIWAVIMGLIIGGVERFTSQGELRLFMLAPAMSLMISVVLRGSPHYGMTRAWYSGLTVGVAYVLAAATWRGHRSSQDDTGFALERNEGAAAANRTEPRPSLRATLDVE